MEAPKMTGRQLETACAKVKAFYGLNRAVTAREVAEEVACLCRRGPLSWDDASRRLAATLQTGKHPIDLGFNDSASIQKAFYGD